MPSNLKWWEVAVVMAIVVPLGYLWSMHAAAESNRTIMSNPVLYKRFVVGLISDIEKECGTVNSRCVERRVDALPVSMKSGSGFTDEDRARVRADVWYEMSGQANQDMLNKMLPQNLRDALAKPNTADKGGT